MSMWIQCGGLEVQLDLGQDYNTQLESNSGANKEKREDESRKKRKRSRSRSKDRHMHKESKKPKDKRRKIAGDGGMGSISLTDMGAGEIGDPGTAESLSIEETNKLRAKLGLSPLDLGNVSKADSDECKPRNSDTEFVHVPAKDLTRAKQVEKLQEKIITAKEKRELLSKLREVKSLGSGEETSVSSWVEKMRSKEKAKLEAEKREQMLTEMDAVFGVSAVVEERIRPKKLKPEYSSASLEGLKVEHSVDRFSEGKPIILTLKDSDVLTEDASDVLTNVNLEDEERAEKNRENQRKLAGLGGILQDEDEDVVMGLRAKGILEKYDVEISGPKKAEFILEANGTYATDHERTLRRLQEELQTTRQSLEDQELRPAADFYTADEMAQFKKKKRRKVQRRILRADDLIPDPGAASTVSTDHGSRGRREMQETAGPALKEEGEVVDVKKVEEDIKPPALAPLTGLNPAIAALLSVQTIPEEEEQIDTGDEDVANQWSAEPLEPDNLQLELEKTLSRVRNANLAKCVPQPEERLQMVMKEVESETFVPKAQNGNSGGDGGGLVFDATAEFFKQISGGLQNDVTAKMVKREAEAELEVAEVEVQRRQPVREKDSRSERAPEKKERHRDSSSRYTSSTKHSSSSHRHYEEKASMSKSSGSSTRSKEGKEREDISTISFTPTASAGGGVFEEEPALNQGVFSALLLAQKKGYVEEEKEKERPMGQLVNLMAKHYVKEDVRYDDIDAKFAKRERYNGPLCDFREKSSYKPDVKLYYVDEMGRNLTPKEAFRQLSHKFHGKGSGKKKTERRTKKIIEEALIKNSVGSDTPLGTLDKLNKKLEKQGTPYVVLSGKGSTTRSLMK
ncbi:U4/U6.U5 tri-snRNP-associated protein 1 [Echinococcus granulosus]|uniref:Hypoxia associated factor n=1 Tax=Echinococcus granulosus TaxID=6210 RepID=A0A068WDY4_ECHGR|nr:U4/U6.U5 tri-snRNP-associated protein 1 [Echinococcus granulosus]CDS15821.1 hypoxia associated factor [Echinococcus granulosus]